MARRKQPTTMQPVCMQCGDDMDESLARRSLTWWEGMKGVRAKLCSIKCRDEFDKINKMSPTGDASAEDWNEYLGLA